MSRLSCSTILVFIFLLITTGLNAGTDSVYIQVRILANRNLHSANIQSVKGIFTLKNQDQTVSELHPNLKINVKAGSKKVIISKMNVIIGQYDTLLFVPSDSNAVFRVTGSGDDRKYPDYLKVYVEKGELRLINRVRLDHLVAGAVLSETGSREVSEFYKVQALISRTYALRNIRKHEAEGFHQCDQVHCQLYRGLCQHPAILEAVEQTRGQVITDSSGNLINAAFHSNSGGETVNSEDVWSLPSTYLKAVNDSFSTKMPMAHWEKRISKADWLHYLKEKHRYPIQDSSRKKEALWFTQEKRKVYLGDSVPLKAIRNDFRLRSTFFSIQPDGNQVVFKGKGFGHGVGLSQEGAIAMVKKGYRYADILGFYYKGIRISTFDNSMIPRKKQ